MTRRQENYQSYTVRIRKKKGWHPAIVYKQHELPNSFVVKTPDGSTYRRTRHHLLKTKEDPPIIKKAPIEDIRLDLPENPKDAQQEAITEKTANIHIEKKQPEVENARNINKSTNVRGTSTGRVVIFPHSKYKDYQY